MKKLSFFFLVACFISLGLSKCKRIPVFEMPTDDPTSQLPPETQTGANTFGCLVDGKPYKVFAGFPNPPATFLDYQFNDMSISGNQASRATVSILGASITDTGIFKIQKDFRRPGVTALYSKDDKFYDAITGELHIKRLDPFDKIISGTFQFTGVDGRDTTKITKGRFDLRYN